MRTRTLLSIFAAFLLYCLPIYSQDSLKTRPDANGPTIVNVSVFVIDIREIDGAKQMYSGDVAVRLRWKDLRLASSEKLRSLPLTVAWNPGIQLVNRIAVQTTLPDMLDVDSEGNVMYRQRYIGQFSCMMDLREFPFDRQSVPVRFAAPGFSPSDIKFVQDQESAIAQTITLTDWKIQSWKLSDKPFQLVPGGLTLASFQFEFSAQRRFYYFLVQIIIPMTLIVAMSWIVFWLDPTQPGPRVSISITSMLTVVAYRLLLSSFLPRLPFLTRMDYFVFSSTSLVFFSLVCIVAINWLLLGKKESAALKLDRVARWIFPTAFLIVTIKCFVY